METPRCRYCQKHSCTAEYGYTKHKCIVSDRVIEDFNCIDTSPSWCKKRSGKIIW